MIVVVAGLGNVAGVVWAAFGPRCRRELRRIHSGAAIRIAFVFAPLVAVLVLRNWRLKARVAISNRRHGQRRLTHPSRLLLLAALLACGVVAPLLAPSYQSQLTELLVFIVFALAWDLVGGQMGYNSFGNVLFVGLGMYVSAVVQVGLFYDVGLYTEAKGGGTEFVFDAGQFLTGLAVGLPTAALVSAFAAWMLGSLVLSMRGHYFAICTLGLGIAAGQVAAGIPWIGAGSGMLTPNPPQDLGDVGLLLYYLALGLPWPARSPSHGCSRPGSASR